MKDRIQISLLNKDPRWKVSGTGISLLKSEAESKTELESGEDEVVIEGYATVYDQTTDLFWNTLSIDKKAFTELKAELGDIVSLFNHDWNYVLGRTPKTLELDPKHEYGLWQKTILPNHDLGKRIAEDIRREALTQQSITFYIDEYQLTEKSGEIPHLHVLKGSIVDVSVVTFGQYPQTTVGIEKLSGNRTYKEDIEKLLLQHKEAPAVKEQIDNTMEIRMRQQEQRKRKARGIHGI